MLGKYSRKKAQNPMKAMADLLGYSSETEARVELTKLLSKDDSKQKSSLESDLIISNPCDYPIVEDITDVFTGPKVTLGRTQSIGIIAKRPEEPSSENIGKPFVTGVHYMEPVSKETEQVEIQQDRGYVSRVKPQSFTVPKYTKGIVQRTVEVYDGENKENITFSRTMLLPGDFIKRTKPDSPNYDLRDVARTEGVDRAYELLEERELKQALEGLDLSNFNAKDLARLRFLPKEEPSELEEITSSNSESNLERDAAAFLTDKKIQEVYRMKNGIQLSFVEIKGLYESVGLTLPKGPKGNEYVPKVIRSLCTPKK